MLGKELSSNEKTEPCPACHEPDKLSVAELARRDFVCDNCYAKDIGRSMSEGYGPGFIKRRP
jgi:endogenous inhibitor of DNA gyrase (YacG/DUF329 family)